jgi:site-specific DNA-cytosine methylase
MIALSCFDGMSCGRIAFERAEINIKKYYASEIDKYAQIVSEKNYPDIIRLGDITKWREWNIENPDIIIGGSPCQGFSFAGKQLNFNDERSKLFFTFVDILKHYKPKYFLLENVVMKKEYNDVISSILGDIYPECITQGELFRIGRLEPIQINSALVSAQNRNRLYWTNIPGVTQPKDKGILLKDIIENGGNITGGAFRGINPENPSDRKTGSPTEQRLEINETGKSNALKSVSKDSLCVEIGKADINGNDSIKRVYSVDAKCPTLTAICGGNQEPKISENNITWRKLTPIECERLQTVPDNYTNHVSNSQRYKMLGNGWTIDVISHIFKGLK